MGTHPVARLVAPLISAGTFLGVSAAWMYDTYVLTPWAIDHTLLSYFIATGPYVLISVFGLVNCLVRANRFFSTFGLVAALLTAGWGLLIWSRYISGHDPGGWGLGFGTIYLWIATLAIVPAGWIAMFLVWQWAMASPSKAEPAAPADRPRD